MMSALRELVDRALGCLRDGHLRCNSCDCASQASPERAGLCGRRMLRRGSLDGCVRGAPLDLPCRRVACMRRMRRLYRMSLLRLRIWTAQSCSSSSPTAAAACCSAECVANAVQAEVDGAVERIAHVREDIASKAEARGWCRCGLQDSLWELVGRDALAVVPVWPRHGYRDVLLGRASGQWVRRDGSSSRRRWPSARFCCC